MRLFVLGAPCSGKSTVAGLLRQDGIDVIDVDDELLRLNEGVWPDIDTKNKQLPIVLRSAATHDSVALFNSYMPLQHTTWLKRYGFLVVLLDVPPDELRRRDRKRRDSEGWSNAEWFDWHQGVIREHLDAGLVDYVIDGDRTPEDVAIDLANRLGNPPTVAP